MTTAAKVKGGRPYAGVSAHERVNGRRDRMLAAGLELFGTRGYLETGVKDVCREAGLTDRYFYESFADKQRLFIEVFDSVTAGLFDLVAGAVGGDAEGPEARLRSAIGAFLEALADDPRKARVVFAEAAAAGPEAERHMRATLRRFSELVATTARPYLPAGVPDPIVQIFSLSVVGTLDRVVIEWQDGELDLPIERIVDNCVALFAAILTGLSTTSPSA